MAADEYHYSTNAKMNNMAREEISYLIAHNILHLFGNARHVKMMLPQVSTFICTLLEKTHTTSPAAILALCYLNRLKRNYPQCQSTAPGSAGRLFLAASVLANKMLQDDCFENKTWSEVSGFPVVDINKMEHELLFFCDYRMHVPVHEYLDAEQSVYSMRRNTQEQMHQIQVRRHQIQLQMQMQLHQQQLRDQYLHHIAPYPTPYPSPPLNECYEFLHPASHRIAI